MTIRARDMMTRDVVSASPSETVAEAARRLAARGISAMPVCDPQGKLVGMVSEGDLLRAFAQPRQLQRAWWLGVLAEGEALAPEFVDYIRQDRRRIGDLMTTDIVSIDPDATAPRIAELLSRHGVKRLPVIENGRIVGIVSRADLIRALARNPAELAEPA